jgi:peptide/nickel transport system permease protein
MALSEVSVAPRQVPDSGMHLRRVRAITLDIWLPVSVLVVILFFCFFGPKVLGLANPNADPLINSTLPPFTAGHFFGTDQLGNDMLSRVLYGGRVSIEVGVGAVVLGFMVGGSLGVLAGYLGGKVEGVVMRFLDILLSFPSIVLALVVATYLGPTEYNEIIAIACFTVPALARLARANTLKLKQLGFVSSSELAGGSRLKTVFEHVVPNVVPPLLTFGFLNISGAMLIDAALSYLGAGVRPPTPTWGNMIASNETYLAGSPWLVFEPAIALLITVLALNLLGDALRNRIEAR